MTIGQRSASSCLPYIPFVQMERNNPLYRAAVLQFTDHITVYRPRVLHRRRLASMTTPVINCFLVGMVRILVFAIVVAVITRMVLLSQKGESAETSVRTDEPVSTTSPVLARSLTSRRQADYLLGYYRIFVLCISASAVPGMSCSSKLLMQY